MWGRGHCGEPDLHQFAAGDHLQQLHHLQQAQEYALISPVATCRLPNQACGCLQSGTHCGLYSLHRCCGSYSEGTEACIGPSLSSLWTSCIRLVAGPGFSSFAQLARIPFVRLKPQFTYGELLWCWYFQSHMFFMDHPCCSLQHKSTYGASFHASDNDTTACTTSEREYRCDTVNPAAA